MVLPHHVAQTQPAPISFYKKWLERLSTDELDAEIQRLKSKADLKPTPNPKRPSYLRLVS